MRLVFGKCELFIKKSFYHEGHEEHEGEEEVEETSKR